MGERITKALHKVEEKKKKRAERRAQVSYVPLCSGLDRKICNLCHFQQYFGHIRVIRG